MAELLKQATATDFRILTYRNASERAVALLRGDVAVLFDTYTVFKPQLVNNEFRALATTTAKRTPWLSNVPTAIESGLDGAGESCADRSHSDRKWRLAPPCIGRASWDPGAELFVVGSRSNARKQAVLSWCLLRSKHATIWTWLGIASLQSLHVRPAGSLVLLGVRGCRGGHQTHPEQYYSRPITHHASTPFSIPAQ